MYKTGFLFLIFFCACSQSLVFEKDYYEKTTGIHFPSKYKVAATIDNGEYLTVTILDLSKEGCDQLINSNAFRSVDSGYTVSLMGLHLLDSQYRHLPDPQQMLISEKDKLPGKTGWIYLLDTVRRRLYCEIDYPDRGGN